MTSNWPNHKPREKSHLLTLCRFFRVQIWSWSFSNSKVAKAAKKLKSPRRSWFIKRKHCHKLKSCLATSKNTCNQISNWRSNEFLCSKFWCQKWFQELEAKACIGMINVVPMGSIIWNLVKKGNVRNRCF